MKLNFLCGQRILEDYINLDAQPLPGVDTLYHVSPFYPKLPFDDNYFDEIYANNAVEHIANINALIQEFYRISKNKATWYILTPGYLDENSWNDPTHFSHWSKKILEFYVKNGCFEGRRYEPALIEYRVQGDNEHGLEFFVTVLKSEVIE